MILREDIYFEFLWILKGYIVFKIFLFVRLCVAVWNIVGDCDEIYNYWESVSLNYLIFNVIKMKVVLLVVFLYMFYKNIIYLSVVVVFF